MNRRQRQAQASSPSNVPISADDIPLAQPDRGKKQRKTKTLYELAAERQAALMPHATAFETSPSASNIVEVQIGADGQIIKNNGIESDTEPLSAEEAVPPVLDTLFLAISLTTLHFTLEVLTVHQYAQELVFKPIFKQALLVAFPTLFLLIHLFRGHLLPLSSATLSQRTRNVVTMLRQIVLVLIANYAGCYLIYLTNDKGYYAVMKNAPSVGTIWVWAVLELGLTGALAGVIGPGLYAWIWGYSFI